MNELTPKEALKAIIDGKTLEYSWIDEHGDKYNWRVFNTRSNNVTIEAILRGDLFSPSSRNDYHR